MRGFIQIYETLTYTGINNKILTEVSFSILYEDGQRIETKVTVSAFLSHQGIVEKIREYFKGDLLYKY